MASYYIYSIRNNSGGYIGLATGAAEYADYAYRKRSARERLDRMLQHVDNAYGVTSSYGMAKETSRDLESALQKGAYKCEFSYIDDEYYGIDENSYNIFTKFWKSSQRNAKMNFAELIYIYKYRNDYAKWNTMWGSQGNFYLKPDGFLYRYPALKDSAYNKFYNMLIDVCKKITWGAPTNSKDVSVLQPLFWPEILVAKELSKNFSDVFIPLMEYRDALIKAFKNATTTVSTDKNGNTTATITIDYEKTIQSVIEKKLKQIKSFKKALSEMGLELNTPTKEQIVQLVSKLSTILKDKNKKDQKTIQLPNFISVSVGSSLSTKFNQDPEWIPQSLKLPQKSATDTVKLHCVNRCYAILKSYDDTQHEVDRTVDFYRNILSEHARDFVQSVVNIVAREKYSGSLQVFEPHLYRDTFWVAFVREPEEERKLFWAPREKVQDILEADRYWDVSQLEYY